MRLLLTYLTTHAALAAERDLRAAGVTVDLIPVPPSVRHHCGVGLVLDAEEPLPAAVAATTPEGLWRVLDPLPGTRRRRYEPYHAQH